MPEDSRLSTLDVTESHPLRVTGVVELAEDDDPRPPYGWRAKQRRENERAARIVWAAFLVLAGLAITLPVVWLTTEMATHWAVRGGLDGWRPEGGFGSGLALAVLLSGTFLLAGFALRHFFRTVNVAVEVADAAERLSRAPAPLAQAAMVDPAARAAVSAMTSDVAALNQNIDAALGRLADVERMIRQQVGAIDEASQALDTTSGGAVDKIAAERDRLMQLTETMNAQADSFAAAIADKARVAREAAALSDADIASAETDMDARIKRLEEVAGTALRSFTALTDAMGSQSEKLQETSKAAAENAEAVASQLDAQNKRVSDARRALGDESARLQSLIDEQRSRAERLADEIAAHAADIDRQAKAADETKRRAPEPAGESDLSEMLEADGSRPLPLTDPIDEKAPVKERPSDAMRAALRRDLSRIGQERASESGPVLPPQTSDRLDELARELAERRRKAARANIEEADAETPPKDKSWREILAAVDEPKPAAKRKEPAGDSARRKRRALERATYEMDKRLNGAPPKEAIKRYEGGQRDVFAVRLLSEGEAELKAHARDLAERDNSFALVVRRYLEDFDTLLELAAGREEAEQALEAFLNSAFGRVYMLLGSSVGYFA